jgi:hypothetical protein
VAVTRQQEQARRQQESLERQQRRAAAEGECSAVACGVRQPAAALNGACWFLAMMQLAGKAQLH